MQFNACVGHSESEYKLKENEEGLMLGQWDIET
jgi:hypothetical protein